MYNHTTEFAVYKTNYPHSSTMFFSFFLKKRFCNSIQQRRHQRTQHLSSNKPERLLFFLRSVCQKDHTTQNKTDTHMETGAHAEEMWASTICVGCMVLCWVKHRSQMWGNSSPAASFSVTYSNITLVLVHASTLCTIFWRGGWTETFKGSAAPSHFFHTQCAYSFGSKSLYPATEPWCIYFLPIYTHWTQHDSARKKKKREKWSAIMYKQRFKSTTIIYRSDIVYQVSLLSLQLCYN